MEAKTAKTRFDRDQETLAGCPAWLAKALACPQCRSECVRTPTGYMACGKLPHHTGLVLRGDANAIVTDAFRRAGEEATRGPVASAGAARRLAWRVLRIRFRRLVAKSAFPKPEASHAD